MVLLSLRFSFRSKIRINDRIVRNRKSLFEFVGKSIVPFDPFDPHDLQMSVLYEENYCDFLLRRLSDT